MMSRLPLLSVPLLVFGVPVWACGSSNSSAPVKDAHRAEDEGPSVTLGFDWPVGGKLLVVELRRSTQTVDQGLPDAAREPTSFYTLALRKGGDGIHIEPVGLDIEGVPASRNQELEPLKALLPRYTVDKGGALLRSDVSDQELAALADGEGQEAADGPAMREWLRYRWQADFGAWAGQRLKKGSPTRVSMPGGGEAKLELVEPTDCPGPISRPGVHCVSLRLRQRWAGSHLDPLSRALMGRILVQSEPLGAEVEQRMIVEAETLVPHRMTRVRETEFRVPRPSGAALVNITVQEGFYYRLVRNASSLPPDTTDFESIRAVWDAYEAANTERDGATASTLVTSNVLAFYERAVNDALTASEEKVRAMPFGRRWRY